MYTSTTYNPDYPINSCSYYAESNTGYGGISGRSGFRGYPLPPIKKPSLMKEILNIGKTMKDDVKNFIIENRTIIYWLAILLILDQWVFDGKFREKLHDLFETLIDRVKRYFEPEKLEKEAKEAPKVLEV